MTLQDEGGTEAKVDSGPTTDSDDPRKDLYEATREMHERLHAHPRLAPLTSAEITLSSYRRALMPLFGLHARADRLLVPQPALGEPPRSPRADLLVEDLVSLGEAPAAVAAIPEMDELPDPPDPDGRLGVRYVVDGSWKGGRTLLGIVSAALGVDGERGARFLAGGGRDLLGEWSALHARMRERLATPAARATAVATARATFVALERWVARWDSDPALSALGAPATDPREAPR